MRAELLHATLVEHSNLIGVADRGKAVGHRQGSALLLSLELVQGVLHLRVDGIVFSCY